MLEERKIDAANTGLSRRDFLVKAGALTAGMAVAGGLLGAATAEAAPVAWSAFALTKKLDPQVVRETAFNVYHQKGGCCIGAAAGLIETIAANQPTSPWANINTKMFKYGAGGVNGGWGTLCGALNGAMYVINLAVSDINVVNKMCDDLFNWYCKNPFPANQAYAAHIDKYWNGNSAAGSLPKGTTYPDYRPYKSQVTTIANNPLCHVSVSKWCKVAQVGPPDAAKLVRCAKLTGDVAAYAALMLNKYMAGRYVVATYFGKEDEFCMDCHMQSGRTISPSNTRAAVANADAAAKATYRWDTEIGKGNCNVCHDDKHGKATHDSWSQDCFTCHPKRY